MNASQTAQSYIAFKKPMRTKSCNWVEGHIKDHESQKGHGSHTSPKIYISQRSHKEWEDEKDQEYKSRVPRLQYQDLS